MADESFLLYNFTWNGQGEFQTSNYEYVVTIHKINMARQNSRQNIFDYGPITLKNCTYGVSTEHIENLLRKCTKPI